MSVGIKIVGRDSTVTVGGSTLVGVVDKGVTLTNENIDTTDDQSSGWQEFAATPGLKSAEFTMSGKLKNLELIQAWASGSQIFAVVKNYPDGSSLSFDAVLQNVSETGSANEQVTFDATFASSGVVTFTAGV